MKKFLNILGSTINAALVGILAGQVFEGGMTSIYWWACIGIVVVGNALQALRTKDTVPANNSDAPTETA